MNQTTSEPRKFTVIEGITVQKKQLANWKLRLNDQTYNALVDKCKEKNSQPMKSGLEVFRGTDMDNFIANLYPNI
jgi:hypothetical protein